MYSREYMPLLGAGANYEMTSVGRQCVNMSLAYRQRKNRRLREEQHIR